jgi:hypothetical protein
MCGSRSGDLEATMADGLLAMRAEQEVRLATGRPQV